LRRVQVQLSVQKAVLASPAERVLSRAVLSVPEVAMALPAVPVLLVLPVLPVPSVQETVLASLAPVQKVLSAV
jgi:hypothetical protein